MGPDITKCNQAIPDRTGHLWRTFRSMKPMTCRRCKHPIKLGIVCLTAMRGEEGRREVNHVDCWLGWQMVSEPRRLPGYKPPVKTVYELLLGDDP